MWKTVLAGTTAIAIVGGTLAYAQQGSGGFRTGAGLAPERGRRCGLW